MLRRGWRQHVDGVSASAAKQDIVSAHVSGGNRYEGIVDTFV